MAVAGWLYGRIVHLGCMAAGRLLAVWPNCASGLYGRWATADCMAVAGWLYGRLGCMTAGHLQASLPAKLVVPSR
ncbi:hypothetical protein PF010_g7236 [Phytophthora fragariae]|uniref:Uncharacterized protein n=1 Tax=Phytophthora fragariae TaxID=53985 RepID=A0A6A3KKD9_9STRA|nr:hypothetical protein PF011_g10941 [Phytophthora fragariae]KAE9121078.1 hypothetical protein PF010_g7236 [Phytophthora fragariae]KAE9172623.1 hypothetical protein PF004_g27217 [Phytophthora fragariae]